MNFEYFLKHHIINKNYFLLDNYKILDLNIDELIFISFIIFRTSGNSKILSLKELSNDMKIDEDKVEKLYSSLLTKQLINIKLSKDGNLECNLDNLFLIIFNKIYKNKDKIPFKNKDKNLNEKIVYNWLDEK